MLSTGSKLKKKAVVLYSHRAYKLVLRKGPKVNYLPEKKSFYRKSEIKILNELEPKVWHKQKVAIESYCKDHLDNMQHSG